MGQALSSWLFMSSSKVREMAADRSCGQRATLTFALSLCATLITTDKPTMKMQGKLLVNSIPPTSAACAILTSQCGKANQLRSCIELEWRPIKRLTKGAVRVQQ